MRYKRAFTWVILPVAVYTLAAVFLMWPLPRHLNRDAAGIGYADTYMMLRQAWGAREALIDGRNPLRQDLLAYPDGFTSRLMWSTPLRWVPPMLLMFVVSPLMAFNLWLLITLALNGTAAYWLGMALNDRHPPAALVGGLVFMAFPSMQGHLSVGHVDVLAVYPLPLFALCLWRVVYQGAGWRTAAWGGAWFALAALGLTSQIIYCLMPLVVFMGLYLLIWERGRLFPAGVRRIDQPWIKGGAMIAWGGALLLIFFGPLLTDAGRAEIDAIREPGRVAFSTDLLAFVSPSPFGPLDDLGLVPGYARDVLATNSAEGAAYLGIAAALLAGIAAAARRESRGWLAVLIGAMVLSLGPLLKWRDAPVVVRLDDIESYVTLPYAALQNLPVFDSTRTAGRFNAATALALGALVSIGAGIVLRRAARRGVQIGLAALIGAVILVESLLFWPYRYGSAAQPPYFDTLAHEDGVRAVLNVPVNHNTVAMLALYQQTIHGKPLIGGQLYRRSPQDPAVLAVVDRAALGPGDDDTLPPLTPEQAAYVLSLAGADRVIVHTPFLDDPGAALDWLAQVAGPPVYRDDRIAAFAIPRPENPPYDNPWEMQSQGYWVALARGADGWQGGFLADSAEWHLYTWRSQYGELVFSAAPYGDPRRVGVWLDGKLLAMVMADGGEVRLPVMLSRAGFHTLRLAALDGCDPYPFALTCLSGGACPRRDPPLCLSAGLSAPEWRYPAALLHPVYEVALDHGLRLDGYTLRLDGRAVEVRLFWRAERALPHSYALFVHVADPDTAEPLAQYADFPAIHTDEWRGGSAWVSDVRIDLPDDLPPGEYAINAGWFDPATGARLAVHGDDPLAAAGIIRVDTVTVE